VLALALATGAVTGCGSSGNSSSAAPKLSGNTAVIVQLSSTANDQLSQFGINLKDIALTNEAGNTVNLTI